MAGSDPGNGHRARRAVLVTRWRGQGATLLRGKDIRNKSLTGKDLKREVTSKHVKNRSLVAKDFKQGQLRWARSDRSVPKARSARRPAAAAGGRPTAQTARPAHQGAGADGVDGQDGARTGGATRFQR